MTDTPSPLEQPPSKPIYKKVWFWILTGVLLLLGTCGWGAVSLFQAISAANTSAEQAFVETVENGLPPLGDESYSSEFNAQVSQQQIDNVQQLLRAAGPLRTVDSVNCTLNSYAGTEQLNGTFRGCDIKATFERSTSDIYMQWREEGEDEAKGWRLLVFNIEHNGAETDDAKKDGTKTDNAEAD